MTAKYVTQFALNMYGMLIIENKLKCPSHPLPNIKKAYYIRVTYPSDFTTCTPPVGPETKRRFVFIPPNIFSEVTLNVIM